ncbi:hypothetical protein HRbin07_00666 [bacterium HR07]|uniref:PTS system, nitrogen regulatory IIA component n=2 Tax=Candidatus Bipolaricaulota TaxID=67810 RepID=H5SSS4_ACEAU|nr:PTS system, nitrogen regulatory IIA component [Candidatus Acetothermum autotrophicum]GBC76465.1 hypothetical protein HRbin07_00666 [bacterium HR07]
MQLTVRDVAQLFEVSERQVYRWIAREGLPAYRVHEQYRCNRAELLEWATARHLNISPQLFHERVRTPIPRLEDALHAGGVFYQLHASVRESAWRALLGTLKLPADPDFLVRVLAAQERLLSTVFGEGIAMPHVRTPLVLRVPAPMLALGFFERPLEWGAGPPVHVLFLAICRTLSEHWHVLSRLSFALRDAQFKETIIKHSECDLIFSEARRVDALFDQCGGA